MKEEPSIKHSFGPRVMLHDMNALRGRSRFVGWLKFFLPLVALLVLFILIGWPQIKHWFIEKQPTLVQNTYQNAATTPQNNNTATHPKYNGVDSDHQPYTIRADKGVEISAEEIDLTKPKFEIKLKSGEVVTLTSSSGKLNKVTNVIHLVGDVTLTHSHGYKLVTSQAWLNYQQGTAYGDDPVGGKGPMGDIQAKGFRLSEKGNKISFVGGSELILMKSEGKK